MAGTILTAAYLNTFLRDNILWMATDAPVCRAYNSANISIANASDTAVTLNSERFDNAGMHSTSSNTPRITIPAGSAGKFLFGALIEFAQAGVNERGNHIKLNGTTYIAKMVHPPATSAPTSMTITSMYAMAAGDYIENYVYQSSGSALNLTASGNYSPELWAEWVRN